MIRKPVVAETRTPVELTLEKLAEGETIDQLFEAYPQLSKVGILTALTFEAAKALRAHVVYPIADHRRWQGNASLLTPPGRGWIRN